MLALGPNSYFAVTCRKQEGPYEHNVDNSLDTLVILDERKLLYRLKIGGSHGLGTRSWSSRIDQLLHRNPLSLAFRIPIPEVKAELDLSTCTIRRTDGWLPKRLFQNHGKYSILILHYNGIGRSCPNMKQLVMPNQSLHVENNMKRQSTDWIK